MLTVTKFDLQCGACPTAWDVYTSDGKEWYVRYRWGMLSVRPQHPSGERIFEKKIGDHLDGYLEEETMRVELRDIFDFGSMS